MLPIKNLTTFFIFLRALYSTILRLHKPIPISPIRILNLDISLLIRIPLLETNKFIEVRQHIDKNTTLMLSFKEIIQSKLYIVLRLKDIHHLANNVLEIKI